jgi:hypothetical protein
MYGPSLSKYSVLAQALSTYIFHTSLCNNSFMTDMHCIVHEHHFSKKKHCRERKLTQACVQGHHNSSPDITYCLPKAEHDITRSTFVPHDIRDRRLLSITEGLSGGQLRHKMLAPASREVEFASISGGSPLWYRKLR